MDGNRTSHCDDRNHDGACIAVSFSHRSVTCLLFWIFLLVAPGLSITARATGETHPQSPETADIIDLVSLEWPPYSGEELAGKGLASIVVKGAFAYGHRAARVHIMPWRRALQEIRDESGMVQGIFPIYDDPARRGRFLLSDPFAYSPLGFVYHRGHDFDWHTVDDLKGLVIGVVGDYANEAQFDEMVANGQIQTLQANDDITLLRLLDAGRIDVAVMDQLVASHILETQPEFAQNRRWFRFHPRYLDYKSLHIGFHKTDRGETLRNAFNSGLKWLNCHDNDCQNSWPYGPEYQRF